MSARRSDYAELELDEELDEPDFVEAVDFDAPLPRESVR